MRLLFALVALFSLALAAEQTQEISIFAWPLSAAQPQTYAKIRYGYPSLNSSIISHTAPSIPTSDDLVRIGFYRPASPSDWTGSATSAQSLSGAYDKTLHLLLDSTGQVFHASLSATPAAAVAAPANGKSKGSNTKSATTEAKSALRVEVRRQTPGPQPVLDKPIVVSADGKVEGAEPEKTFIGKYWWIVGLFLLFQIVMGGGDK